MLTAPQRVKLAEVQKKTPRSGGETAPLAGNEEGSPPPLDRAEELALSRPQVERLAAQEIAARRQARLDRAELQIESAYPS